MVTCSEIASIHWKCTWARYKHVQTHGKKSVPFIYAFSFHCLNMKTEFSVESEWNVLPCKYSNLKWTRPCANCSQFEALSNGSRGPFQHKYWVILLCTLSYRRLCTSIVISRAYEKIFKISCVTQKAFEVYRSSQNSCFCLLSGTDHIPWLFSQTQFQLGWTNFYRINFLRCRK